MTFEVRDRLLLLWSVSGQRHGVARMHGGKMSSEKEACNCSTMGDLTGNTGLRALF
jgi:hypothetical protein